MTLTEVIPEKHYAKKSEANNIVVVANGRRGKWAALVSSLKIAAALTPLVIFVTQYTDYVTHYEAR